MTHMKKINTDIAIIGGGLTGLMLAYLLRKTDLTVTVIEARDRLGGRILTTYQDRTSPIEMGATWLGNQHQELQKILKELNIEIFEQVLGDTAIYEPISTSPPQLVSLPPNTDPSYRIRGGSSQLISRLAEHLKPDQLHLGQVVKSIQQQGERVHIQTASHLFDADIVVSTLPPFLLTQSVGMEPALPENLMSIASQTHTWMGESIKVSLVYKTPFWRAGNSSGTIMSNVGPIPEMYEHANYEDSFFALKGFLNGAYFSVSREERLALVMNQLKKYYGPQAETYLKYAEKVWRNEVFTFAPYASHVLPHQHNGHPVYQQPYWNGKLFVAGAETSPQFPGYMEGAIRSAQAVCKQILNA